MVSTKMALYLGFQHQVCKYLAWIDCIRGQISKQKWVPFFVPPNIEDKFKMASTEYTNDSHFEVSKSLLLIFDLV